MIVGLSGLRSGPDPADALLDALAGGLDRRAVFVPAASRDDPQHTEVVRARLNARGWEVHVVRLLANPSRKAVEAELGWASLVYLGGGSAALLVKHAGRYGLTEHLCAARDRGALLAGASGGAIALFEGGFGAYNGYRRLPGLGLAPGLVVPHFAAADAPAVGEPAFGVPDGGGLVWSQGRHWSLGAIPTVRIDENGELQPLPPLSI